MKDIQNLSDSENLSENIEKSNEEEELVRFSPIIKFDDEEKEFEPSCVECKFPSF